MNRAQAVKIRHAGGPEVLELVEVGVREPEAHEVLIRVVSAGLNRADVLQRRGFYPAPTDAPSDIPGLEFSGTVELCGHDVKGFIPGDSVMGLISGGAMSSYVVVDHRLIMHVPKTVSLIEAAAIPEAFITAYDALTLQASIKASEFVLIHAVGSGVGTAAIQLTLATGAIAIGTSRNAEKLLRCEQLGLKHPIHVEHGAFSKEALRFTNGHGADTILDTVGAAYAKENLRSIATQGRFILVGLLGGTKTEIDLGTVLTRRIKIIGTVLRSRSLEERITLINRFAQTVLPMFQDNQLRPVVDSILPVEKVREAHSRLESNQTFGKIIMQF